MIVDRLAVHHTYEGRTAFDVSMNHHHGRLENVAPAAGVVRFEGGADCVRVMRSPTLAAMRAVRTTVRFAVPPQPWGIDPWYSGAGPRRMNLIEGYLSFALVIDADRSLHGTILDRSGHWRGTQSPPDTVTFGSWHEATFVHDGFSACRIDLDGVTVAEAFDVLGPVSAPQNPYGIAIGHWPDPDDRYSFIGDIGDVKLWIDRPEAIADTVNPCCIDREGIDELFGRLRGENLDDPDFDPADYDTAVQAMLDLGSKTFGTIASGGEADRERAWDLARRFLLGFTTGDRDGFVNSIAEATRLAAQRAPAGTLEADSTALVAALQPTLLGPLAEAVAAGEDPRRVERLTRKLGIDDWLEAFCFGWAVPPREPPKDGDHRPPDHPGKGRPADPVDRDPDDLPPSWGAGLAQHHDDEREDS